MFTLCAKSWYASACWPAAPVQRAAHAQELAPVGRRRPRVEARLARREALLGLGHASELEQRFAGRQVGLDGVGRRNVRRGDQLVGARDGLVEGAAADGELDLQHLDRPLVPLAGLRAVAAVGLAGLTQIFAGAVVGAAHQVDLRQRVEDGAGRLVELHRLADLERPHQHFFGAVEVADLHEHLAERGQRDRQAVPFAERPVERHAALGEGQRLVEPVRHQRQDGLVVGGAGQHVVGVDRRGEALGQPQRRGRFLRCGLPAPAARPTAGARAPGGACRRRRAGRSTASVRCSRTMPESPTRL